MDTQLDIRRADERFATRIGWLDSKHSFSFGRHQDRANTHHGLVRLLMAVEQSAGLRNERSPDWCLWARSWVSAPGLRLRSLSSG